MSVLRRIWSGVLGGCFGGLVFFVANLFFGGSNDSAYTASFYGFWIFAVLGFIAGGRKD